MTKSWLCCLLALLFLAGCKSQNEPTSNQNAASETVVSSTPPFQTKEPDRYRATRITTIHWPNGETVVTKNWIARDGDMRRRESETASKRVAYLDLSAGKFVLLPDEKVYADLTGEAATGKEEEEEMTPDRLLHADMETTSYQKLGTEAIGGRNANKYRIVVNNSTAPNVSASETLIWIDDALNMPIRSETKSSDGTRITMELTEVVLDVDKTIFQVPDGYEKIAFKELRKRLTKGTE